MIFNQFADSFVPIVDKATFLYVIEYKEYPFAMSTDKLNFELALFINLSFIYFFSVAINWKFLLSMKPKDNPFCEMC